MPRGLILFFLIFITTAAASHAKPEQRLLELAATSRHREKPCAAFAATAARLLASTDALGRFSTLVLTEAAFSQVRSYPGAPKEASQAYVLAHQALDSGEIKPSAVGPALESLNSCAVREYESLWSALLASARHFNLPSQRLALIGQSALEQIRRGLAAPVSPLVLTAKIATLRKLIDLNYANAPAQIEDRLVRIATESRVLSEQWQRTAAAPSAYLLKATETLRLDALAFARGVTP